MKTPLFKGLFPLFFIFFTAQTNAQVTIGSGQKPPAASVLNVQTQADANPAQGGQTANGGLLLPRVILEDINSLKPFITNGGTNAEKAAHKGMNVYHIGGNSISVGQYVWDGARWLNLITSIPPTPMKTAGTLFTNVSQFLQIYDTRGSATTDMALYDDLTFSSNRALGAAPEDIIIEEDGFYAVTLRAFARHGNLTANNPQSQMPVGMKGSYWIHFALCGKKGAANKVVKDNYVGVYSIDSNIISLSTNASPTPSSSFNSISQSITFTGYFEAGEKLSVVMITNKSFQVTYNGNVYSPCLYKRYASDMDPDDSALIYWKL